MSDDTKHTERDGKIIELETQPRVYMPRPVDPTTRKQLDLDADLHDALEEIAWISGSGSIETWLLRNVDQFKQSALARARRRINKLSDAAKGRTRELI